MWLLLLLTTSLFASALSQSLSIELAGLGSAYVLMFPPGQAPPSGRYQGMTVNGKGYIYSAGTLPSTCAPFTPCGISPSKTPEFPTKVIGTYNFEAFISSNAWDPALNALFVGNISTYLSESGAIAGKEIFFADGNLKFSGSADFDKATDDKIYVRGMFPWGTGGQSWKMIVLGGSGKYSGARGESTWYRIGLNGDLPGESLQVNFTNFLPSSTTCFHESTQITYKGKEMGIDALGRIAECHIPHTVVSSGVSIATSCKTTLRLTSDHLVYTSHGLIPAHEIKAGDLVFSDVSEKNTCTVTKVSLESNQKYFGLNCLESTVLANGIKTSTFGKYHSIPAAWMRYASRVLGIERASRWGDAIVSTLAKISLI